MSESPDAVATRLAAAVPDAAGVAELTAAEAVLSDDAAWDGLRALERQIAWLQARQLSLLARAAGAMPRTYNDANHDRAQEELSCALTISANAAGARLALARMSAARPTVAALLARGGTTIAHLRVLEAETTTSTLRRRRWSTRTCLTRHDVRHRRRSGARRAARCCAASRRR